MSRKNYIALADAIARMMLSPDDRQHVANRIAYALASDNGRFDRTRFLTACGVADVS